jgi:hypothetical protein
MLVLVREMPPLPSYKFEGYTFRPATEEDLPLARRWNAEDGDHNWEAQFPNYWIEQNSMINSYLLEDARSILFFVKSIRHAAGEIEITLQFDCSYRMVSRSRSIHGMVAGFRWLKKALPLNGFRAVYFVSKSGALGQFAVNVLGFVHDGQRYLYSFENSTEA